MTRHSQQLYERRIALLEKESAQLSAMLRDCCKLIEKFQLMKQLPASARDFWGSERAKKRGKEAAGKECFQP